MKKNIKEPILYVDDEIENLDGFKYTFMLDYDIEVAQNAKDGLKLLEHKEFKIVISDQRMPEISGIEFLKIVKEKYPNTIRIVLTAYADITNAIEAINNGEIYRYLSKPWEKIDLKATIENAIETYDLKQKNKKLITDLQEANHELLQTNNKLNEKIIEVEETEDELRSQNEEYATLNEEYKTQNIELLTAKDKIEENELKYKILYNNTPVLLQSTDLEGNLIAVNNYWLKTMGYTEKEAIGTKVSNYLTKESKILYSNIYENYLKNGFLNNVEIKVIKKDKTAIDMLVASKILKDKTGQNLYSMTNMVDISLLKEAENIQRILSQELMLAKNKAEERNQLKTEFINNMSHEIRTPMNGILGFSNLLNEPDLTEKKRQNYINIIQNSGQQLLRIIDDILEISQLGTKQVIAIETEICLNDLFLEMFSVFDIKAKENKTPLYLKKGHTDKESTILTDKTKLIKVLSNLLENAIKFTHTGYIEFGYSIIPNGTNVETHGSASPHDNKHNETYIQIYVKDTGIGINSDKQEIIFERFSQEDKGLARSVGGLGLGLSIAKENIELLDGTITLKSEKGKGSTFFVTIPYKSTIINSEKYNSYNKDNLEEKQTQYTVLIVEDEEVNYLYLETLLDDSEQNLKILHAINGKEAVNVCKKNSEINLILMDMKMSHTNGFEATKIIKKFRPNLPIVAQTAYSTKEYWEKAIAAGCDDFISKPISKETLFEIINKWIKIYK